MHVLFGAAGGVEANGLTVVKASMRDDASITKTTEIADEVSVQEDDSQDNWHTWQGTYQVPAGQTSTRIAFKAVSSAANDPSIGNFIDDVYVTAEHGTCASGLAATGYDAMPLTLGGSAAVLAGIGALVVARRRTAKK